MNLPYNEKRRSNTTFGEIVGRVEWGSSVPMSLELLEQMLNFPTDLRIERVDYNPARNSLSFIVKPLTNEAAIMFCHEIPEGQEYPIDSRALSKFVKAKEQFPDSFRWSCQDLAIKHAKDSLCSK